MTPATVSPVRPGPVPGGPPELSDRDRISAAPVPDAPRRRLPAASTVRRRIGRSRPDAMPARGFSARLFAAFGLAIVLAGLAHGELQSRTLIRALIHEAEQVHAAQAAHIANLYRRHRGDGTPEAIAHVLETIQARPGVHNVFLIDDEQTIVAAGDATMIGKRETAAPVREALAGRHFSGLANEPGHKHAVFEYVAPLDLPGGRFVFELEEVSIPLTEEMRKHRSMLFANLALSVAFGFSLFYVCAGRGLSRMYAQLRAAQVQRGRVLERIVHAAEEERTRLAAELHDGPIQRLSSLGYGLERVRLLLERGKREEAEETLTPLQAEMSREVGRLRGMMSELRPPVLDERGLEAAVGEYVHAFSERSGIRCEVRYALAERPDPALETVLYRLVQEALTNVEKHSRATRTCVVIEDSKGSAVLQVTDDGVGFDPCTAPQLLGQTHYGLAVMRERVEAAAGTWDLRSKAGKGTTITAVLPRRKMP